MYVRGTWQSLSIRRLMLIIFIICSYIFFAWPHCNFFEFSKIPRVHYQYLTEGFLNKQLNLSIDPPKELLSLPDPYDPIANAKIRLHDASLYQGKYYLYFGPLPAMSFFLPIKLLTGFYVPQALSVLFFLSLGFIFGFLLLVKLKDTYFPSLSEHQLILAGCLYGLCNNALFLLSRPSFYEAAISSAYCYTMISMYLMYKLITEKLTVLRLVLFSLTLNLAVAGRPHFALVSLIVIPVVLVHLGQKSASNIYLRLSVTLLTPMLFIGMMLITYNYLRFHSVFEFGLNYQLTGIRILNHLNIAKFYRQIGPGLFYYIVQTPSLPFYGPIHYLNLNVSDIPKNYFHEFTAGMLFTVPFLWTLLFLPQQLKIYRKIHCNALHSFLIFFAITPIITFAFLSINAGSSQRYATDFLPYLVILAITAFWLIEQKQLNINHSLTKIIFYLTALIGIFISIGIACPGIWFYTYFFQVSLAFKSMILSFNLFPVMMAFFYVFMRCLFSNHFDHT